MQRSTALTAAAVVAALAIVGGLLISPLTRSESRLQASNLWLRAGPVVGLGPGDRVCQQGEVVPAGASFLTIYPGVGAPSAPAGPLEVTVRDRDGRGLLRSVLEGPHRAGPATVPIEPLRRDAIDVSVCVRNGGSGEVTLDGYPAREASSRDLRWRFAPPEARPQVNGQEQQGPFTIEYPLAESRSPLQMRGEIADRAGYFKSGWIDGWALWGALGLAVAIIAAAIATIVSRRRWVLGACVAVAVLNAVAWAMLTPPLQTPDELPHIGHAQYLAETGNRPEDSFIWDPPPDLRAVEYGVPWGFETKTFWMRGADTALRSALDGDLGRVNSRAAGFTNNNPPLYYAYEAIPYRLGLGGTLLDRILLMRLATALMAGLLALFVFLFIREVMPTRPLAAAAGALTVGIHPLAGHIAGGVSPDAMLWAFSAGVFWIVARSLRRGLTVRRAVAIGVLGFAATMAKPAGFMLVPGVVVGLLVLIARARVDRRQVVVAAAACGAVAVGLLGLWHVLDQSIFGRGTTAGAGFASTSVRGNPLSIGEFLSYLWQFWIPRPLGFMTDQFTEFPYFPSRDIYFYGFVGRFGWHQYDFGTRTENIAAVVFALILLAAAVTLVRDRASLRGRWGEGLTYAALLVGVVVLVNAAGYRYRNDIGHSFEQTRYLFPALLPMWGLAVALAVSVVRGRWRLPLAVFVITLLAGHNLAAHLLTVQRYYL